MIDHWTGLTEPKRQHLNSPHAKDWSNRFEGYDGILINKDRPFHTLPPVDTTEDEEEARLAKETKTKKDEQIARLDRLILDDRLDREAKEAEKIARLERAAMDHQYINKNRPTNAVQDEAIAPVDDSKDEVIARLENCVIDVHSQRAAKKAARLAAIHLEETEKATREQELAHGRTWNSGQYYTESESVSAGTSQTRVTDHQGTESPDLEPSVRVVHKLTEHQLLLLCPVALAYALGNKQWSWNP